MSLPGASERGRKGEREKERERRVPRRGGEGVVKGNGGGRREAEDRENEERRAPGRDRDKRRGERRGQPPLLPRVDSNAGDISTNQITPRAPPFIIILLVFPLLHPHWMTFAGPYRGTKKAPAPRRGLHASRRCPCSPLVPSWYPPWSSRHLLHGGIPPRRAPASAGLHCLSLARARLTRGTCTRCCGTLTTDRGLTLCPRN